MFRLLHLRLLLAFVFAVGQSFALAHATQHEFDSAGKTLSCEICAVAHSGGGLPSSAPVLPALQTAALPPATPRPASPTDLHRPRPQSRGPPSRLS
jgi:hypothetical protein